MGYVIVGGVSFLGTVFTLGPSITSGAMSVIGVLIAMATLIMAILLVKAGNFSYFGPSEIISGVGISVINDELRFYDPLSQVPWQYKLTVHIVFLIIRMLACLFYKKHARLTKN